MRRTNLIAVILSFMALAIVSQDAFARGRMYNPALGRFMQRDPLGTPLQPPMARNVSPTQFTQRDPVGAQYTDGMNLYQYVGSNPLVRVDPSGLEWKVVRNNGKRRATVTGECGDKVSDLAPKINMDPDKFVLWLKVEDGKARPKTIDEGLAEDRTFSVPNVVFVGVGEMNFFARGFTGSTPGKVAQILQKKGFNVDYQDWYFMDSWNANQATKYGLDQYGLVYFGHGMAPGKPGWRGKKSGDDDMTGWLAPASDGSAGYISPGQFHDGQLGLLILKSCFAANGGWAAKVSPNGASWLGNGFEAAGFDSGVLDTVRQAK